MGVVSEFGEYVRKFRGKNAIPLHGRNRIFAKVEQSYFKSFRGFGWFMF